MNMAYAKMDAQALSILTDNNSVEFVEYDSGFESAEVSEQSQYALNSEYKQDWGISHVGADKAHKAQDKGQGIRIAILDTGVNYNHPDLMGAYAGGYDFINNDNDPMDDNGHGTHVAGIIAASNDGVGIVGMAPDVKIYAIKVSDKQGRGTFSGLVEGINWAIENNIDIVTMSITGNGGTEALQKAVKSAYQDHGILLFVAVGNEGSLVGYPAAYDEVIGVGYVNQNDIKSSFSNIGPQVEIVAPGSGINSTWIDGKYRMLSGTSMATPFVTGAAALLLASDEQKWNESGFTNGDGIWTNAEVRSVLQNTALDLGPEGKDDQYGYGLLEVS